MGPTINEVFAEFLAAPESAAADRAPEVIDLLRGSLDSYAYQWLSDDERAEWAVTWEDGAEPVPFCDRFGPDRILSNLPEFLGYYVVRKVHAEPDLLVAAAEVSADLARWLVDRGYAAPADAVEAIQFAARAADELPRAEQLSRALYRLSRQYRRPAASAAAFPVPAAGVVPRRQAGLPEPYPPPPPAAGLATAHFSGPVIEERDLLDAAIVRIDDDALWFAEADEPPVGPLPVPPEVAELAELDWNISALVLERTPHGWRVAEAGTVYPL